MANATMQALKNRRKLQIEAREQESKDETIDKEDQHRHDGAGQVEPVTAPENEDDQAESDIAETDDNDNANEETEQPADEQPAEPDEQPQDFKRKFERLSGKMSKTEKAKAQAEAEAEKLRQQLAKAEARLAAREEINALSNRENADNQRPTTDDDTSSVPDTWFENGDFQSETVAPKQGKAKGNTGNQSADDIDRRVDAVLAQRDKQRQQAQFADKMDAVLADLGDEAKFFELVNEPDFDAFVSSSRSRLAIFNDAAVHQDDEAVKEMTRIVADYLGKGKGKEKPKSKQTPEVKKQGQKMQKPKPKQISYEQYQQAVKDKRHPAKRKAANQVIAAWEKQNE